MVRLPTGKDSKVEVSLHEPRVLQERGQDKTP